MACIDFPLSVELQGVPHSSPESSRLPPLGMACTDFPPRVNKSQM